MMLSRKGFTFMEVFNKWQKERKHFLVKITFFTFFFFLALPLSIELFPNFMGEPVVGWISFAWIFGFTQIIVTWILGWIYWKKAQKLDALLNEAVHELEAVE